MGARTKPPPATTGYGVLGPDQLRGLARHRYRAPEGRSLTDPYLEPLWRWVMEQTPTWWAPNTLILVGLIVNGATTFLLMVFCGDATGQVGLLLYSKTTMMHRILTWELVAPLSSQFVQSLKDNLERK